MSTAVDVRSFKLLSGEEIITRIKKEESDFFIITDSRSIIVSGINPQTSEMQTTLVPYMTSAGSKEQKLYKHSIACESEMEEKLQRDYVTQTTGLVI